VGTTEDSFRASQTPPGSGAGAPHTTATACRSLRAAAAREWLACEWLEQCLLLGQVETGRRCRHRGGSGQRRGFSKRPPYRQNADLRSTSQSEKKSAASPRSAPALRFRDSRRLALITTLGGLHAAPRLSEKIRLVTQYERQVPRVLGDPAHPPLRPETGGSPTAEPLERRRHAGLRIEVADGHRSQRARLLQPGGRRNQVLIRRQYPVSRRSRSASWEDPPPGSFGNLISWIASAATALPCAMAAGCGAGGVW